MVQRILMQRVKMYKCMNSKSVCVYCMYTYGGRCKCMKPQHIRNMLQLLIKLYINYKMN